MKLFYLREKLTIILICGLIAGCSGILSRTYIWDSKEGAVLLRNPTISEDNKFMLFAFDYFKGGGGSRTTIVLYDIAKDIIVPFPLPREVAWNEPVFSPDGRYLAVGGTCLRDCPGEMAGGFIALINVQKELMDEKNNSINYKLIKKSSSQFQKKPAFSPDGKYLHYVEYRASFYKGKYGQSEKPVIKRVAVNGGGYEVLYTEIEEPVTVPQIVDLNPVNKGGFLINALFRTDVTKKLVKENRMRRGNSSAVVYLRPDQAGTLLTESDEHPWAHSFNGIKRVSVSRDGRIIFNERSKDVDRDPETGYFSYDLFVVDDGKVRQLTQIRKSTSEHSISPDGSIVAALVEGIKRHKRDIWIIDAKTGEGRATGLNDRLLKLAKEQYPNK